MAKCEYTRQIKIERLKLQQSDPLPSALWHIDIVNIFGDNYALWTKLTMFPVDTDSHRIDWQQIWFQQVALSVKFFSSPKVLRVCYYIWFDNDR